ncbi:fibrobacter succinogenes major paralogous domain-containing protein [bacterium]|nr:fibrobacter succinogenes major paralogous domain-containing protein [bacterium]
MKVNKVFGFLISIVALYLLASGFTNLQENNKQNLLYEILDETVTDYDGNIYKTVKIGTQIWMLENLKVTHYRNGTLIPNVHDNDKWPNSKDGAYCLVNNDTSYYKKIYGALYNFYAVINVNKLSPEGWHIPTEEECLILINYLGGKEIAGEKIKNNSQKLWKTNNNFATNESGFSGLPAGGRGRLGSAGDVGYYATWWSCTPYDLVDAWHWGLHPDKKRIRSNPGHKASGFSVRCVKN